MPQKLVEGEKKGSNSSSSSSLSAMGTIFMHADLADKFLMTFGFLGAVGDGLITPVKLLITSKIINTLGKGFTSGTANSPGFTETVNKNAVSLLYMAAGAWVVCFLEGYCWTRTGERQASRMRIRYLKAVLRQDVEYFDLQLANTSQVVTSVSSDSLIIQDCLSEKVPNFITNVATFLGSYIVAFCLMWRLTLVAFPTMLLLIIPGIIYGKIQMGLARKIRNDYDNTGTIAEKAISSIKTVYSFVAECKTMAEFSASMEGSIKLGLRQGLVKGLAMGSNGVTFAIWALISWYSSNVAMYHSGGGTIFAIGASVIIGGLAVGSGLSNIKNFSEASSAGERIMEVIKRVPKIDSNNGTGDVLENVVGELEFRAVKFSYPSRPKNLIFESFTLNVQAGKTVALIGGSGSGKSTVVALLERFYDPQGGEILLDGVEIKKLKLKWLRSQMGLVNQEPALFATSIKENILFGKEDASMEEVVTASKAANAHNFISQLPRGYDTQVGEGGVQMSGGQKQRIAIARAVLKSPKILLLDEATSALDYESERIVQEALDLASVSRTTIVIAHRLSTIQHADVIAVVQAGQIMETGSHDDLIGDPNGLYTSLIRLQETNAKAKGEENNNNNNINPSRFITGSNSSQLDHNSHSMSRRFSAALSRTSSACSSTPAQGNQEGEGCEKEAPSPVHSFRRLLLLNLPEWRQAALGCLSATLFGAVQPVYAFVMGSVISMHFQKDHEEIKSKTRIYALFFLFLTFFSFLVNIGQHYSFAAMGEYLTKRIRERMLSNILTFEVAWFDKDENSTGFICSRLAKDANVVRSLVGGRTALLVQTLSAVSISFALGLILAWRLALVMIAVQPLIILCFYVRRSLLKKMSGKAIKAQSESSKLAAEMVTHLRTITAFSSQDHILQLFVQAQEGPHRENIRQSWFAGLTLGTTQGLMSCTWALDFWYGGKLISQGYVTFKAFFQTFMILVSSGRVIANAGSMTTDLTKGADSVRSVFAVLDRCTHIEPEDPDGLRPEKLKGSVELRDVHFTYSTRPDVVIFNDFSLSIEAGKSTALVGQSGSGKSTIIGLIERFYDPLKGTVRIDGKDIRSYHLRSLRRHIALVGQEATLFAGSIRENITYGMEKATEAEIEEAARVANAHDFISVLQDGYDTWCGDKGVQLSGGQKQRIAIARAILKNPAILLLDEATSALDRKSENVVQEALERVMVGRTSVVVAHRLSTIQNCDLIAVLDKGEVVEKGTHSSLLAKGLGGFYYSLVSLKQRPKAH